MVDIKTAKQRAFDFYNQSDFSKSWGRYFWEIAERISDNSLIICDSPDAIHTDLPFDRFSLITAGLFVEAGTLLSKKEQLETANKLDLSAGIITEIMSDMLGSKRITFINKILLESDNKRTSLLEAKILSDARALEDFGIRGILAEFLKALACNKGISDIVAGWQTKTEYGYWDAMLENNIHFEITRTIAKQRLKYGAEFIKRLSNENSAKDIDNFLKANVSLV